MSAAPAVPSAPAPEPHGRVRAAPLRLPFDYLDKVCVAATSREHGTSSAPVWQLGIRGRFDPEVAFHAVLALVRRYPVIASRAISAEPGRPFASARRLAWEADREPDRELLFHTEDVRGDPEALERLRQRLFDNHLDPETEYPVRFTWARSAAEEGVLFVQQHHAIADGAAFFDFVRDFCRFYDAALAGDVPEKEPVPRLREDEVAVPDRARRLRYLVLGLIAHVVAAVRILLRPADPLASNVSADFTGANRVEHLVLPDTLVERVRAARTGTGLSLNDLLAGALALALSRWTTGRGMRLRRFNLLLLADSRPRGASVASFANHLCSFVVDFDLRRLSGPLAFARAVRAQVASQARRALPVKKLVAEVFVARLVALGTIRRLIFAGRRAVLNLPFSNLIPISPPERFRTAAWTAEGLRIMTPCLHLQGANVTVIRYSGGLCLNFNHKASAVPTEEVRRLVELFRSAIGETLAAAGVSDLDVGP